MWDRVGEMHECGRNMGFISGFLKSEMLFKGAESCAEMRRPPEISGVFHMREGQLADLCSEMSG